MPPTYCPICGAPRVGAVRYCSTCRFDFDTAPEPADPPSFTEPDPGSRWSSGEVPQSEESASDVDDIPAAIGRRGRSRIVFAAVALLVVVGLVLDASGVVTGGRRSGGPSAADLPPAGSIWFGSTFDPTTFVLSDRTTIAGTEAPVSFVARLTRRARGSEMAMRWSWNGSIVTNTRLRWDGEGEIWGGSAGPLSEPGEWRLELTDAGGNTLASGTLVVTRDETAAN